MGNLEETMNACYENKDVEEPNKIEKSDHMGFVQALDILHKLRDAFECVDYEMADAFNIVFEWIDNQVVLLHKIGATGKSKQAPD